jgi:ABC transport system ATP-binding/permease protein
MVFGNFFPTFWVNVCVIWFMTVILYFGLYYRVVLRFLDYLEQLGERFSKGE